jgi:sugar transferase (PEP-CTERM system associated)
MIRIFSHYVSAKSRLLMLVEGAIVGLSLICAAKLRFWSNPTDFGLYVAFPDFAVQIAIVVVVCLACFYCNDLYDLSTGSGSVEQVLRVEQSLGAATLLLGLLYFLLPGLLLSRGVFIIGMALVAVLIVLSRKLLDRAWHLTVPLQRVVILGTGQLALDVARELKRREDLSMKLEGFVSGAATGQDAGEIFGFPVLGAADRMEAIAKRCGISRIIVALEDRRGVLPTRELVTLRVQGVRVDEASSALSALTGRIALRTVKPSWFVFSDGFHRSKWNELLKRILDLAIGAAGLVLALPVMALVALAVRLDSKGPVLYRQTRVGWMGKSFEMLKFRSMRVDAEKANGAQWASKNDPRVTRVGGFLRKYRLDELPQLLNVIRGEMSFVGPRPERPCFVQDLRKTIPYYDERHSVRPGITGWAQVQYIYGSSVEDAFNKLEYDFFYLKHISLTFDLVIIFKTIRIVLGGHGGR